MEQVAGERETEQQVRGRIETEFDLTVLRDASAGLRKNCGVIFFRKRPRIYWMIITVRERIKALSLQ